MRGRNNLILGAIVAIVLAAPAFADVKTGIDAYQRGDFATAVNTWRPLADAGDADAQYNLGQSYRLGRGVPVDAQIAESWFRKAADQGHERARNAYGLTLFQRGRRAEAIPYIEESAGRSFPQSQYVYATLLFNGDMVEKDWVRAYALMTRAAEGDVAAAKAALVQLDLHISLEQRQRGLKLASVFANATPKAPDVVGTPVAVAGAAVAPAGGGAWRVQLGAFGVASNASALWSRLRSSIGALGPHQSFLVPAGALTRLQAGQLPSRAAADTLCASVRAGRNVCVVVSP